MRWGGAAADDEDALYLWCQSRGEFGCVGGLCDEEVKRRKQTREGREGVAEEAKA